MENLSLTIHIDASPAAVWHVLEDFGSIDRWSPGIKSSRMLTEGPVGIGSTRHCDFKPFGSASERIEEFVPLERLRVVLTDISMMMPLETAEASFVLSPAPSGTDVAFQYSFRRKGFSRLLGGLLPKMLESGLGPLLAGLKAHAEGCGRSDRAV